MKDLHYLCDKETFLKLKEVNKHLTAAKHAYAAWYRAKRKTVHKKPIPDLSRYEMFFEEHARTDQPYSIKWIDGKTRSNKSYWCKNDTGAYCYFDPLHFDFWCLKQKEKRGDELSDDQKQKLKYTWYCLHTYYIDEEYTRARHPHSPEYIAENPLKISKERINAFYAEIQKITDLIPQRT